jgi:DNA-binding IscR family transcriptional regulator
MLSSKLSVGVHMLAVLVYMDGEPITSEQLGESVNTNPVVIRRLLGLFREAGYVESKNGVGGGWLLVADPRRITMLDVLQTVEPQNEMFALHRCEPNQDCPVGCNILEVLTDIYDDVRKGVV